MLIRVLPTLGFTREQCHSARLWILAGDWRFKKSTSLDASDFFPTDDQLRQFKEPMIPLSQVKSYIGQHIEQARLLGYSQGYDARKSCAESDDTVHLYQELVQYRMENMDLLDKLKVAEDMVSQMAMQIDAEAQRRIELERQLQLVSKTLADLESEARESLGIGACEVLV